MNVSVPVDDSVRLNVRQRRGGTGRPFLLVHGLGSNSRMWDEVAGPLAAAGHPVHAVDMRGHGASDLPRESFDNATATADLAAVCDALDLGGVLLAGHSWGGNIAMRLAAVRPGLAAGLALVDGGGPVDLQGGALPRDTDDVGWWGPDARTPRKAMLTVLRAIHPRWSDSAVEASLADMVEGPDGLLGPRLPLEHYRSVWKSMWNDPPARWYPDVTVPVVLLKAVPPNPSPAWLAWARQWVADAEAALPQAESRWYTDSDHNLHADHPERVAADLLELARTVDKQAGGHPGSTARGRS